MREIKMLSLQEKASLEKCISGDEVVPLLRDLFQQERYEDIVEAIELHIGTQKIKKGRRDYLHNKIIPLIYGMIGKELSGHRIAGWERFFKDNMEGKTWQGFIMECLQNGKPSAFLNGIQVVKQSFQDFKNT